MFLLSGCGRGFRKMASLFRKRSLLAYAWFALVACGSLALLSGCGMGKLATSVSATPVQGAALQGKVHGGNLPVVGATIQLWAASTAGYPLIPSTSNAGHLIANPAFVAPHPLVNCTGANDANGYPTLCAGVSTLADGTFTITNKYSCVDTGDPVYITAAGGNPGLAAGTNNTALEMMVALGTCGDLVANAAKTFINIDEVTTIASVYALAQFAALNTSGTGIVVGTSGGNITGLTNAMATVGNMVDIAAGTARTITPAYANGNTVNGTFYPQVAYLNSSTVPAARINTLANILATCVNTTGTGSGGCTSLMSAATPSSSSPYPNAGVAPADTLQAALNVAQNPGTNVAALFALAGGVGAPFQTPAALSAAPNDWTLALTFTGGGLGDPSNIPITNDSLAIDVNGNVWVGADTTASNGGQATILAEFSPLGAPQTPATTVSTATPSVTTLGGIQGVGTALLAFDEAGSLWTLTSTGTSGGGVNELMPNGTVVTAPLGGINGLPSSTAGLAIDGSNNIWLGGNATNGKSVYEWSATGTLINTYTPMTIGNTSLNYSFDSSGNLWLKQGFGSHSYPYVVNSVSGAKIASYAYTGEKASAMAAGTSGNMYECAGSNSEIAVYNTSNTTAATTTYVLSAGCGNYTAVDGLGNIWTTNNATTAIFLQELNSSGTLLSPATTGYTGTSSSEFATLPITTALISGLAIDGSGNLWVTNYATYSSGQGQTPSNALVEYVGVAAPIVTPTSVALSNNQIGVRP